MNKSDLAPLRERLETLQRTQNYQTEASEPMWEHPRSPELPVTQPVPAALNRTQQAAVVEALQRRSQPAELPANDDTVNPKHYEETTSQPTALPTEVNLHWQRLQQEAITINELGQKQAIAIQNFKRSADRLAWSLRRHPSAYGFEFEQFCELHQAVVSQVLQDTQGKLTLHNVAVDLHEDERHATQTAEEIRALAQTRAQTLTEHAPGLLAATADPLGVLETCWQTLTRTLEARSRLTPLDIVIWLGGGLIGRLAIQLALAASPGLWPWLVGATVGAVALALYRLLFAPRPDVALVARLFLALVGLVLGGKL
ncbi:MAG: hypothetical protein AAFQ89_07260 [Cyanobacteria bacterium J06626_18]